MQAARRLLRCLVIFCFFIPNGSPVFGQQFSFVFFNQLPQDYQLYPRNEKNEAEIPVSGTIEAAGYSYMSVVVTRNDTRIRYIKAPITYTGNRGSFSAGSATIKAELANYNFSVYACKASDSVLIVKREKIVSGDAFVIMGQSNSTGFFSETETNDFCRTFGVITGTLNIEPYDPADTLWTISNRSDKTNVGAMGLEIQKRLAEQSGVPNCLINGGFHWSSAFSHAIRTENNPADLTTGYGRMLYRLQKSGVASVCKAFIYRQGETEAYNEGWNWEENFDKLYHHLKTDIPALKRMYVFQIDIIYYPSFAGTILRDYQRRLPDIYPDIRSLATVGTKAFDGLHYGREGNVQSGFEVSRLICRDFYNLEDTLQIDSPNIRKVFYKNSEKKELVLVFDEHQELVYPGPYQPNGSVTLDIKDFFYLDDFAGAVGSGKAEENRVTLTLNAPQNAGFLNYLPPYLQEGGSYYPFTGPFITNGKGMRAFTFYHVPIGSALGTPALSAATDLVSVDLKWDAVAGAESYVLQRKKESESRWTTIGRPGAATTAFTDTPGNSGGVLSYRIKAESSTSESAGYGLADISLPVIAGTGAESLPGVLVYPNPLKPGSELTIELNRPAGGILSVYDALGRTIDRFEFQDDTRVMKIPSRSWVQGLYFLQFESGKGRFIKKIVTGR
ncbi:MAG: hypothetical protein ABS46_04540 [Cytophagaceae bacterium SCN 52-12]|nr:MAG: hypothetical protein ABS46_04540 [Cytophagaceae bacterium SCN 52-12]